MTIFGWVLVALYGTTGLITGIAAVTKALPAPRAIAAVAFLINVIVVVGILTFGTGTGL